MHFLADHGWKLLPCYRFDPCTGLWHHRDSPRRPRATLSDLTFAPDGLEAGRLRLTAPESVLPGYLAEARRIVAEVEANPPAAERPHPVSPEFERLRWFPLPHEAAAALEAGPD